MNPHINPCANGVTEYVDSGFSYTSLGSSSTPQGNQDKIMSKRAAQNRAAQKAFRQRKDLYIKDLELKAKSLTQREAALDLLKTENESLKSRLKELEGENARLRKSLNIQPDKSPTRPSQDPSFRDSAEPQSFYSMSLITELSCLQHFLSIPLAIFSPHLTQRSSAQILPASSALPAGSRSTLQTAFVLDPQ
ncbi:hypothetical protein DSO57_1032665 [Entomophthora muscae]|uniref:Uncharacterized protein n=1 Tax=Entomophthora muscae TaxID=34485 RepID=A0ACC2RRB1_9FUNG|nr:hypothetical protein DSO57_1032665 [Entomophthora muscae]